MEQGLATDTPLAGVLVTAWLQTQNFSDSHRRELAGLAVRLPGALLDAIEHSAGYAHSSARLLAVNALRAIPRELSEPLNRIVAPIPPLAKRRVARCSTRSSGLGEITSGIAPGDLLSASASMYQAHAEWSVSLLSWLIRLRVP